jgi:hypothetical protein
MHECLFCRVLSSHLSKKCFYFTLPVLIVTERYDVENHCSSARNELKTMKMGRTKWAVWSAGRAAGACEAGETSSICSIKFNVLGQRRNESNEKNVRFHRSIHHRSESVQSSSMLVSGQMSRMRKTLTFIISFIIARILLVMANHYSRQTTGAAQPTYSGDDDKRHHAHQLM